jgi:hypothetical protein
MGGAGGGGTGLNSSWLGGTGGTTTGGGLSDPNFDITNFQPGFGENYNPNDPAGWTQRYSDMADQMRKRQQFLDGLGQLAEQANRSVGGSAKVAPAKLMTPRKSKASKLVEPHKRFDPSERIDYSNTMPLIGQMMGWEGDPEGLPLLWRIAMSGK